IEGAQQELADARRQEQQAQQEYQRERAEAEQAQQEAIQESERALQVASESQQQAAQAQQQGQQQSVSGTVVRADTEEVVLRVEGQPDLRLKVTEQTTALLQGQNVEIEQIEEGTEVRASYQVDQQGEPTATRIEGTGGSGQQYQQ